MGTAAENGLGMMIWIDEIDRLARGERNMPPLKPRNADGRVHRIAMIKIE